MSFKPQDIIEKGDDVLLQFKGTDSKLLAKVLQILAKNTIDGKVNIPNKDLALIEEILYDTLKESDYSDKANQYLGLFVKLQESMIKEQIEVNRLKRAEIEKLWSDDTARQKISEKVLYDLSEVGLKKNYITGLAEAIREQNYFNRTIEEATEILRSKMDGYTENYLRGTVKDSLSMYDGAFQDKIRVTYGFENILYVGNVIETTRPICTRLRKDLKGRFSVEQLKKEVDNYCPQGKPSESKITYSTVSGKEYTKKKGAGMYEGTTIDNFSQFKGGHECRHRALPTR